jgi:phosphoribosylaminoimidazole-succinocarboxamide synthase
VQRPYGLDLPKGLKKNDPLPRPAITPTTKAAAGQHDERLTEAEVISRGLVAPELWEQVRRAALAAFRRGQERARAAGLILVDTKYEFGTVGGKLVLIDEVHTPDCSRYWSAAPAQRGAEPESFDKEQLRLWFAAQGYRGEGPPPLLPAEFVANLAARYIYVYEKLTGRDFVPAALPAAPRIAKALEFLK